LAEAKEEIEKHARTSKKFEKPVQKWLLRNLDGIELSCFVLTDGKTTKFTNC
jgi:phosphoribosylamine-glycine ligase